MKKAVLMCVFVCAASLQAAPARNGERYFKQPDGTVFSGQSRGDEYLHWIETSDGDIVIFNRKKREYEKAEVGTNRLIGSGKAYHNAENAGQARSPGTLSKKREALHSLWMEKKRERKLIRQDFNPDLEK